MTLQCQFDSDSLFISNWHLKQKHYRELQVKSDLAWVATVSHAHMKERDTFSWPTFGFRPRLPLTFFEGLTALVLLARNAFFSGTDAWLSALTRLPLFLERSSGWMRGRTPPFEMVTPRRSWKTSNFEPTHRERYFLRHCMFSVFRRYDDVPHARNTPFYNAEQRSQLYWGYTVHTRIFCM